MCLLVVRANKAFLLLLLSMVQSAVHDRNVMLHVAIRPLSTKTNSRSTNQPNVPKLLVLRNSRRLFLDEKLLWSSPGRVANVTRSKSYQNTFYSQAQTPYFTISPSTSNFTKLKSQYTLRFMGSLTWAWHNMSRTLHTSPPKLKVFS